MFDKDRMDDAIWRHNGGAWDQSLRKRLPIFSNIQIAALTGENMVVFLLFSETNRASRFSPLCVAVKPQKSELAWNIIEDVKVVLTCQKIAGTANLKVREFPLHFLTIQKHALENNYDRTIKLLSSLVVLYCGFQLDQVVVE